MHTFVTRHAIVISYRYPHTVLYKVTDHDTQIGLVSRFNMAIPHLRVPHIFRTPLPLLSLNKPPFSSLSPEYFLVIVGLPDNNTPCAISGSAFGHLNEYLYREDLQLRS